MATIKITTKKNGKEEKKVSYIIIQSPSLLYLWKYIIRTKVSYYQNLFLYLDYTAWGADPQFKISGSDKVSKAQ